VKILFCLLLNCFVQLIVQAQVFTIPKLDSIQINFFERTSTIQFDNCHKFDEELKQIDSYKIIVKDSILIRNFQLDKNQMEKHNKNMHYDASIWNYKDGKIEKYCVNLFGSSQVADEENNIYPISNKFLIGLLNHYLYFKIQEGEYECLSSECSPITNNYYIFSNMIRLYQN
jgi:hypothetical protein